MPVGLYSGIRCPKDFHILDSQFFETIRTSIYFLPVYSKELIYVLEINNSKITLQGKFIFQNCWYHCLYECSNMQELSQVPQDYD